MPTATDAGSVRTPVARPATAPAAEQDRDLREPDHADAEHLAGHQLPRPDRGQQQLDDAAGLLLDHALRDHLAVHQQRDVDQNADDDADHEPLAARTAPRARAPARRAARGQTPGDLRGIAAERGDLRVERHLARHGRQRGAQLRRPGRSSRPRAGRPASRPRARRATRPGPAAAGAASRTLTVSTSRRRPWPSRAAARRAPSPRPSADSLRRAPADEVDHEGQPDDHHDHQTCRSCMWTPCVRVRISRRAVSQHDRGASSRLSSSGVPRHHVAEQLRQRRPAAAELVHRTGRERRGQQRLVVGARPRARAASGRPRGSAS